MATAHSNMPLDPFEAFRLHIEELFEEATNFLDGGPIANEAQADAVSALLNRLRRSANDADDRRKAEKKPHDDAAQEVQAKWKPILDKADLAAATCKQDLAPWLEVQEAEKRRAVEAAQREAEEKLEAARLAAAQSAPSDLAGQATARGLHELAADAEKRAKRLDRQSIAARGGERAVTLRTSWNAQVVDPVAFGKWAWEHRKDEYVAFLTSLAIREARHGPRDIPGLRITETRTAV